MGTHEHLPALNFLQAAVILELAYSLFHTYSKCFLFLLKKRGEICTDV